jgi:CheY-like chemotaxis protein
VTKSCPSTTLRYLTTERQRFETGVILDRQTKARPVSTGPYTLQKLFSKRVSDNGTRSLTEPAVCVLLNTSAESVLDECSPSPRLEHSLPISTGTNSKFVPTIKTERSWNRMNELTTKETILVVDDTDLVLGLVVSILKTAKYNVLQADSGIHAIDLAKNHAGKIELLLSDVQMPGMTGPNLGSELKKARPDMRVMFMSAFTGGNLLVLNYGWSFIEKPFVSKKLLEMVNNVLHTPNKSQSTHEYDTRTDTDPDKKIEAGQTPQP